MPYKLLAKFSCQTMIKDDARKLFNEILYELYLTQIYLVRLGGGRPSMRESKLKLGDVGNGIEAVYLFTTQTKFMISARKSQNALRTAC